jgi:hypothetical protein
MKTKLTIIAASALALAGSAHAQIINEGFDNVPGLFSSGGWVQQNLSSPVGPSGSSPYVQGDPSTFSSFSGAANSYVAVNFEATGDQGTISAWLMTSTRMFNNGDIVQFMTRTQTNSLFPDRLEVRFSTNGASTDAGNDSSTVGDFTHLLGTVNSGLTVGGYPTDWTMESYTVSGLSSPILGRLGLRYYVTDAGAFGNNSNIIGLDNLVVVPEPASLVVLGLGVVVLIRRRKRAA